MDLTDTITPKSDQINAEDLLTGPITVTVDHVTVKRGEDQPVDIHLVETPGRCYRPSKTMRRIIVKAWGKESDNYPGRRMTLYRDPEIKWGGQKVGGIAISHVSHIDKEFSLALTQTRGKRTLHTVRPLKDDPPTPLQQQPEPTAEQVAACTDTDQLRDWWHVSRPQRRAQIEARVAELTAPAEDKPADDSTAYDNDQPLDGWPEPAEVPA